MSSAPSEATYLDVLEPSINTRHTNGTEVHKVRSHVPCEKGVLDDDPS